MFLKVINIPNLQKKIFLILIYQTFVFLSLSHRQKKIAYQFNQ